MEKKEIERTIEIMKQYQDVKCGCERCTAFETVLSCLEQCLCNTFQKWDEPATKRGSQNILTAENKALRDENINLRADILTLQTALKNAEKPNGVDNNGNPIILGLK